MKNALDVLTELVGYMDRRELIPNPDLLKDVEARIPLVSTLVWARILLEANASKED